MPLFTIPDTAVKAKLQVNDILGLQSVTRGIKKLTFVGWGGETSHVMFRPLHHSLTVNIGFMDKIDTSDLV